MMDPLRAPRRPAPSHPSRTLLLAAALGSLLLVQGTRSGAQAAELGIDRDGPTVRLTLPSRDPQEYSLEALEDLLNQGSLWNPVATVAPAEGPTTIYDPTCTTRPRNFYRLRLLPQSAPVDVPNFRLLDQDGRARELFYQSDVRAMVLVLAGADPAATLAPHAAALRELQDAAAARPVRTWILATGSPAERTARAAALADLGLRLPVLEDEAAAVTRRVGSGTVPETVVVNTADWSILYRGRLADRYTGSAGEGWQSFAREAVDRHLAGKPVVVRRTTPEGQALPDPGAARLDYAADIAPLLQRHCVHCHSPGNIAPWSMTSHSLVSERAALIRDELLSRRMPPWHADRTLQSYSNDAMLPAADLARILDWIDRGAPRGTGPDPLSAEVPPPPPEWPLGTPDRIVSIQTQSIPASGTIKYRYLVLPNPFPEDVWLRAAVVKPGNPKVVHHALIFSGTVLDILQIQGGLGGYFAAYVPGMDQVPFPADTGKLLRRGAFLVFQMHYTATGTPETDRTQLGLYLAPTPPSHELKTSAAYDSQFVIPAGASDHVSTAEFTLPRNAVVYEMSPHMHYRGNWMRFDAILPDQRRETLLHVPYYRFDWQSLYRLSEPRRLPAGTRIVVTAGWDNSPRNPYNPDPSSDVRFGEQSWEEMMIGYFNWAESP